ncbi:MAG TPA: trypsin-like peptidase domain-containing protein [Chloroflexota bacterium]|nr:trypsin-like peptidase domain-containing protein [Chloroflexota bacterium]
MTAYGLDSAPGQAATSLPQVSIAPSGQPAGATRRRQIFNAVGLIALATGGGLAGGGVAMWGAGRLPFASPAGLVAPVSSGPAVAGAPSVALSNTATGIQLAPLYKKVAPAVVDIRVTGSGRSGAGGEGSGFIADEQGHVVTNYHVVRNARQILVRLLDGTRLAAEVVATDPANDLAVLRADIPAEKRAVAPLGDSDAVEPGEPAIAIGSPFGLEQSITAGIVSAVDRSYGRTSTGPIRGLIQTDAPVNPGNSGGPLFNAAGEVIGINSMGTGPVNGNVGVAFAIPVNAAKRLLAQAGS